MPDSSRLDKRPRLETSWLPAQFAGQELSGQRSSAGQLSELQVVCAKQPVEDRAQTALQELMELERAGLRVTWPAAADVPFSRVSGMAANTLKPPTLHGQPHLSPQSVHGAAGEHVPFDEMQAAVQELAELERSGLRVTWPG